MLHPKNPKDSGVKSSLESTNATSQKPKGSGVKSSLGGHECYITKTQKIVV